MGYNGSGSVEESGENDVDRDSQRTTVKSHYLPTVHGPVDYRLSWDSLSLSSLSSVLFLGDCRSQYLFRGN